MLSPLSTDLLKYAPAVRKPLRLPATLQRRSDHYLGGADWAVTEPLLVRRGAIVWAVIFWVLAR